MITEPLPPMVARRESASWEIPSGIGGAPKIGSMRAGPVRLRVTGRVGGPAGQFRDLSADHPSQTPNRADGALEAGGLGLAPLRRLQTVIPTLHRSAFIGTRVMFTGEVYLLSAPEAESIAQPIPPPRTILPKVAPAASDLLA